MALADQIVFILTGQTKFVHDKLTFQYVNLWNLVVTQIFIIIKCMSLWALHQRLFLTHKVRVSGDYSFVFIALRTLPKLSM